MQLGGWLTHFLANARRPALIDWSLEPSLDPRERALLERSIATFQLGESSDGSRLRCFAREYSARSGDDRLVLITEHFIREEQLHASLLAEFMERNGIPRLQSHWSDFVFRALRSLAGYELSISVLISAEIIGIVYYRCLRAATSSWALRTLCTRLLEDEDAHVAYESDVLTAIRQERSPVLRSLSEALHRFLFAGAALAVWIGHHGVLRAGGLGPLDYLRECASQWRAVRVEVSLPSVAAKARV